MIKIQNLFKTFFINKKPFYVLREVNLEIKQKEIFGLIGDTGSGKTTLLNILSGFLEPDYNPRTLIQRNFNKYQSAFIFQNFNLLNNINVFENVSLPLKIRRNFTKDKKKKILEIIDFVGLKDFVHFYPNNLSGGQKQRVAIARSLVYEPKIIFCDEPTSALNINSTKNILRLFYLIYKKLKTTIVLVSHDPYVIKNICNRVSILNKGKIEDTIVLKPSYNFEEVSYSKLLEKNNFF
ncbi:MAG: D-methionine transport system ATP-binding protein [Candidatus Phytoplasma cynodontis]|uniref:ATP-binding cassette domain-containing protein n=1 Tax='Cynodon dactylon' phytoplasma TaxID=295320 RepID=UPI001265CB5C|nr:ATP-binding cassette domain-containing protein ['Cynodon dactylon' phytoplasma]KAB8122052.1 ATP-binding cassette domain-containing protein ['Cynodon dactylon' phytoplasma]WIA07532.1 MAG: D-methionine transport system ATP-binding protein [Candidatus Phytoplasma cynodontis]